MSNSEMSAERRGGRDPIESGGDGRDELKAMLDTIATQLQDADRRHTAALSEMQDRISGMGREADSLRARVPDQFAPAFQQIEAGIGELAHRLADSDTLLRDTNMHAAADFAAHHSRSASRQRKAVPQAGSRNADPVDPWDQQTAEALSGVYASEGPSSEADADASATSNIDEAWLESRFAEIARGIEYSLAHVKPENSLSEFGERFDQFERQFAKLFAGVATHDDLFVVRQIEAHMGEVVHHLEKTNDQLDRLNTLEMQIATVSKTLAQMQASSSAAKSADIEAVARAVAEETAQRFAARQFDDRSAAADELRPLIQQLMTENRQGGEQTAALLDTMQQAMVRLLDRVEAIDVMQPASPRVFEADATARDVGSGYLSGSDVIRDEDFASEPHGDTAAVSPPLFLGGYDLGMSSEEMAVRSEKLRQEFIADARRAKMRLASEGSDIEETLPPSLSALQSPRTAAAAPVGRPIRPSKQAVKNASGPSAPSPRLMLVAALVVVALAGLWYVFGFENRGGPVAAGDAQHATSLNDTATAGASDAAKSVAPASPETPANSNGPAAVSPAPGGDTGKGATPEVNGPRGDLAPMGDGQSRAASSDDQASGPRTTLPMLGVAVDLDHPISEAELLRARRHQAMANLSGELGSAAARSGDSAAVPASMVPSAAETDGDAPAKPDVQVLNAPKKSASLEMPSAMVGPLSLRLAAANGDSSAQFEVGARFAEGEGVKQDFVEAAKWYQRSADQGFAQAQYRLATLYERGLGLKPDRGQASMWYQRAAEQGNVKAMHNLAVLSANQTDRSPDYATAAQWFGEAAKRGLPDSQFNLAILYENGLGVTRDLKQAFMWASLAAQGGDVDAIRRRDILRGKLTAEEIAEAKTMIAAWRMTPTDRNINDALAAGGLWKNNPKNGING
jgi:localization factor PodJL